MQHNLRDGWSLLSHAERGNYVEWVTEQAISGLCVEGDTAIDVGANYGAHTHTMLQRVGRSGHVIAFEANPKVAAALCAWIPRNPNLEVREVALADFEGEADFFECENAGFSSLIEEEVTRHGRTAVAVRRTKVTRLDAALSSVPKPVRLMKIDVEGAELAVLRGGANFVCTHRPYIIVEMGAAELKRTAPNEYTQFEQLLRDANYAVVSILGELTETPLPGDYQFILVPLGEGDALERVQEIAKIAGWRFYEESRHQWTPYLKFQSL
jgi:FkbM family methyltransferase